MTGQMGTTPNCQIIYPLKISAERVAYQRLMEAMQPFQAMITKFGWKFVGLSARACYLGS